MLVGHWPLIGNFNDYSGNNNNLTYQNNNNKIIIEPAGKIGAAYKRAVIRDGADWLESNNNVNFQGDFTFAIWAYVSAVHSGTANGLLTNHNHNNNTGAGITVREISSSDYRISCNTGTGSSRTFNTFFGTTNIKDKWSHLVLRFIKETNTFSLWTNGNKELEWNYAQFNVSQRIGLFSWSLGYNNNSEYRPAAIMNDARVYDHALSDYEVKELAKAKILHYTFENGTAGTDISGLYNNGTLYSGATVVSSSDRKIGSNSMEFNGTGGFYTSPITLPTYTIAFWANRDAENKMPIGSNGATLNTTFYWYGDNSWRYVHGGVGGEYYYPKTDSIPIGTWGHYAVTYDGASVKIYRNGKYEGAQSTTGSAVFNPGISIGFGYNGSSFFYDGKLDDTRVYATALSDADILNLYNKRANFDNLGNVSSSEFVEKINYLDPAIFTQYSNNSKDPGYQVVDGRDTWRVFPAWYHPNGSQDGRFKANTQYEYNIWIKHSSYWTGGPYYVPGGFRVRYTDGSFTDIISSGAIQDWVNLIGITVANKTIDDLYVYYFVSYEVKVDINSYFVEAGTISINNQGIADYVSFNEVDGTENINAQQEIKQYNKNLLINGEFSEVD
jgi:hypothetical protein